MLRHKPLPLNPAPCFFLRLPPEIRNTIYELLLVFPDNLKPNFRILFPRVQSLERQKIKWVKKHKPETVLALARTCSAIRDEVLPIYYGSNTFSFQGTYDAYRYLYMIGKERRALLKRLQFSWCKGFSWKTGKMSMQRLTELLCHTLDDCVMLIQLNIGVVMTTVDGSWKWRSPQRDLFMAEGTPMLMECMRGRGEMDIRVRDVNNGAPYCVLGSNGVYERRDIFKEEARRLVDSMGAVRGFFTFEHVREFEQALRNEARKDKGEVVESAKKTSKKGLGKGTIGARKTRNSSKPARQIQHSAQRRRKVRVRQAASNGEERRRAGVWYNKVQLR